MPIKPTSFTMKNFTSDEYYNRGNLKGQQNDFQGAIEDYNKAIEINPKDAAAYYNRGIIKMILGQDSASFDLSEAAALGHEKALLNWGMDALAYYKRGNKKIEQQDFQEAIADFTSAIELDPLSGESYYKRGFTKLRLNLRKSGWQDLKKAKDLGYELNYQDAIMAISKVKASPNSIKVPTKDSRKKVQIVFTGVFVKFNADTKERALRYNYVVVGGDVKEFMADKKASGFDSTQDEGEHAGKPSIAMLKNIGDESELQRVLKKDGTYDWYTDEIDDLLIEAIIAAMSPADKQKFAKDEVRTILAKKAELVAFIKAKRAQAIADAEEDSTKNDIPSPQKNIDKSDLHKEMLLKEKLDQPIPLSLEKQKELQKSYQLMLKNGRIQIQTSHASSIINENIIIPTQIEQIRGMIKESVNSYSIKYGILEYNSVFDKVYNSKHTKEFIDYFLAHKTLAQSTEYIKSVYNITWFGFAKRRKIVIGAIIVLEALINTFEKNNIELSADDVFKIIKGIRAYDDRTKML